MWNRGGDFYPLSISLFMNKLLLDPLLKGFSLPFDDNCPIYCLVQFNKPAVSVVSTILFSTNVSMSVYDISVFIPN